MRVYSVIRRLLYGRHSLAAILSLGLALVLAACGSKGYAPPLGATSHAALADTQTRQTIGDVTLTPIYAMHVAVYYQGKLVPTTGAQTPAQLRSGNCFGPVVAPLTDGAPKADIAPAATQPVPAGGIDIALQSSANWYVTVLERPNDATAPVVACGHPLSERRQFFDLYPPAVGNGGIAHGTALMEPVVATQVHVVLQSSASPVTQWALHSGSCSGPILGASTPGPDGLTFNTVGDGTWVAAQLANGTTACGQVKS